MRVMTCAGDAEWDDDTTVEQVVLSKGKRPQSVSLQRSTAMSSYIMTAFVPFWVINATPLPIELLPSGSEVRPSEPVSRCPQERAHKWVCAAVQAVMHSATTTDSTSATITMVNVPGDAVSKASVNLRIGSEASAVALLPSSGRCVVEVGRVSCSVSVPSRCAVPASSCVGCVCAAEVCKWAAVAAGGVVPSVTVCQPVPCDSSGRVVAAIHPAE